MELNHKTVNSVLDSGAGCSVIDIGTLENLGLCDKIVKSHDRLINASGKEMDIAGVVSINVEIKGTKPVIHDFKVLNAKTYSNVLLGRDFMKLFGSVTFNFAENKVHLGRTWINGVQIRHKEKVRLSKETKVPARSEQVLSVRCKDHCSLLESDFEPRKLMTLPGLVACKARVVPNVNGIFHITVLNTTQCDVIIPSRHVIGHLYDADEVMVRMDPGEEQKKEIVNPIDDITLGENLSSDQQNQIRDLVTGYKDIFADNPKNPTRTILTEHKIVTGDSLPVKNKMRRVPTAFENEVDRQVQEMLKHDIIRPSCSPWNSPLLLVKKKDNSLRFVCDFRGLNDVTKKDNYPLPHIRDVVDKMEGSRFWTTLDAASAYWSMPLSEEDKEKTAFAVPRGKYEFNVTPYGLTNAGASYQRMMDLCLSGLSSRRILAYMDDIVIFSRTFEEHIADVKTVFERLRAANISLKASKCIFGSSNVDFLGYELSSKGIKPQKRLTDAIRDFARPENRKEVRRFLGMAGFYRNFIRNFGDISHPMNKLTSDNVKFLWDEDCEKAFIELKQQLSSEPVLAFPRLGEDFIVDVDASDLAFGGVLMQEGSDSQLHPVAYFSDSVQKSQKSWAPTTKEAFALVLAVRHWHVYLAGRHFVLNSDHNPLVFMRQQKDPRGKFARWILELEDYDYTVKYVKGVENVKADALSRNSNADSHQPSSLLEEHIYHIAHDVNFLDQLKEEQNNDPVISIVKRCVENGEIISKGRLKRVQKQLRIENEILTKSGRFVIPASLRVHVLNKVHVHHFGVEKTYSLLQDRFYWPNMFACTKLFVDSCETCQRTKIDTNPPKAPLIPMFIPTKPMEFISIDVAYMPIDNGGYQYFLLIGDIFSKFIHAEPLKDQTAPSILKKLSESWLYVHGTPPYLLSDQQNTVDGEIIRELCVKTGIEKRRSSAYHSQGNGFAERNIRNVKDIMRSVLLHRKLDQVKWRQVLQEVVFALNCSESSAIKAVPYNVVFGRSPVLPIDVEFGTIRQVPGEDVINARDYTDEIGFSLNEVFDHVIKNLKLSKFRMQKQYNRNLKFIDHRGGEKVWLKVKHYKTGENRKLAPRRTGPWTVVSKLPNGVNFKIRNDKSREEKIVHHDRISPIKGELCKSNTVPEIPDRQQSSSSETDETDSESSDDYEPSSNSDEENDSNEETDTDNQEEVRFPRRVRTQREIPGTIPWSAIRL